MQLLMKNHKLNQYQKKMMQVKLNQYQKKMMHLDIYFSLYQKKSTSL